MTTDAKPKTEAEKLFVDLDKPSLHALSYALRHPDTWPKGFVWNYEICSQCAMGLAHLLWGSIPKVLVSTGPSVMARAFAMPFGDAKSIFVEPHWGPADQWTEGMLWWRTKHTKVNMDKITPEMVADQIDEYLTRVE